MSLSVISFTGKGRKLSEKLAACLEDREVFLYTRWSHGEETMAEYVECSVGEWAGKQMRQGNGLVFIGACGIAVRAVAPYLTDKLRDCPVLVMDEEGRYVIPILSGHVGGANELARTIAESLGAVPVITTATDLNKSFAVDLFAKENHLQIMNKDGIAKISSSILAGKEVSVSIQTGHLKEASFVDSGKQPALPEGIRLVSYPPSGPVDLLITAEDTDCPAKLLLRPREYVIGMGCKKGMEEAAIKGLVDRRLSQLGISMQQIYALGSIDVKKDEEGFLSFCRKERIPFLTFTAQQLQEVSGEFQSSDFVRNQVGVDNVCERAALRICGKGGSLISPKYCEQGMTIAVAKKEWSVWFDEQ